MTIRKDDSEACDTAIVGDVETAPAVVADHFGAACEPLPVRLSEVWSEIVRLAGDSSGPTPRKASAVPILDDMKGILQWD
jgi:hypothetical protein